MACKALAKLWIVLSKIDAVFSRVTLVCPKNLDDQGLGRILATCSHLKALDLGDTTAVSIDKQLETEFPPTMQEIKGILCRYSACAVSICASMIEPATWISQYVRGEALMNMNSDEQEREGRTCLERVIKRAPNFVPALALLGKSYLTTAPYNDEHGKNLLKKVLTLDPTYKEAHRVLTLA